MLDGTLEGVGRSRRDVSVVLDGDVARSHVSSAGTRLASLSSVGIFSLEVLRVVLKILEGLVLPSTIAAVAGLVTRNEFLLGKAQEVTSGSEVSVLHGGGGRESPAGTAVSLILDGVDSTLGSPIPAAIGR